LTGFSGIYSPSLFFDSCIYFSSFIQNIFYIEKFIYSTCILYIESMDDKYITYVDSMDEIGKTAKLLDSHEIIYRIRLGRKTMSRVCLVVLIWIVAVYLMGWVL